jgi:hypothetical protein
VIDSGAVDRFDRPLVWVKLPDGRAIDSILINEKLARRWTPDYKADWCSTGICDDNLWELQRLTADEIKIL